MGLLTPLWGGQYVLHPALPSYLAAQWCREADQGFEEERQAARRALLAAYTAFGAWLDQQIATGSAETALALLERQRWTMGQLLGFALSEGRFAEAQAILRPLNAFWDARGLAKEAKGWVDRVRQAVEGAGGTAPDFGSEAGALWRFAVGSEANRAIQSDDLAGVDRAHDDLRRTLEAAPAGDNRDRRLATVYHGLGIVALLRGDLAAAEAWYRRALEIEEALGDQLRLAGIYYQLGTVAQERGDLAAAEAWYRRVVAIEEALGDQPGLADIYRQLGTVALLRGDLAAAEAWYHKALAIFDALGNRPGLARSYGQLGLLAEALGDLEAALEWMVRCVALFSEFPHPATGPGPQHLARLTAKLGMPALEGSWRRRTGTALPPHIQKRVSPK